MGAIWRLCLQPNTADGQGELIILAFGEEFPSSVKLRFPYFVVAEICGDAFCRDLFHGRVTSAKVLRQLILKLHRCLVRLGCATGFVRRAYPRNACVEYVRTHYDTNIAYCHISVLSAPQPFSTIVRRVLIIDESFQDLFDICSPLLPAPVTTHSMLKVAPP